MDALEIVRGEASFAYNSDNGLPWHRMGTPVRGNQTAAEMARICGADFTAYKTEIQAVTNTGLIIVPEKIAVCAERPLGPNGEIVSQIFGVLGDGYTIVQYLDVAEKAEALVGVAKGQGAVDTMGLLYDGKRFFAYIDLGSVFLDPNGINDEILRGLLLHSSHDGSIAVTYAETDTRAVCANTVALGLSRAVKIFKAKHTASVNERIEEAEKVMKYHAEHTDALLREAEALLSVEFTEDRFERVLTKVFPDPSGATDRQKKNALKVRNNVRGLFINSKNSVGFGENGWTMYNAITEYLDHHREATDEDRAIAAMTPGTWVEKKKIQAADLIGSLR